ncbi:MAG: S41 family peptidase [Candidatus Aminicenantales bacterium]
MQRIALIGLTVSMALFLTLAAAPAFPADSPPAATLSLADRVVTASQLYSAVQLYFGHWKGVPNLDLEKEYGRYVQQVIASDSRRDFDLASMEFLAALQNGHSSFSDKWFRDEFGQMLGFYAYPIDGEWVVTRSSLAELPVGEVITAIDGEPFDAFYQRNGKYISASDERWRRRSFFERTFLFPPSFTVTLKTSRKVSVTRKGAFQWPGAEVHSNQASQRDGVAILRIPAFMPSNFENSAVEFLKTLGPVKAVILDLRGNHGGSTPDNLVAALMDRPYRWKAESTAATIAVLRAWGMLGSHAELSWSSDPQQPSHPLYTGPLYILVDGGCFSACEDFLVPFKDNHRAMIIGERTGGSTGQSYSHNFGNGMGFAVSTKREYFPDGAPFEGVGVAPDIEVHTSAADLKTGNDPVLARALDLITQAAAARK